jgi:O-6-methylguanine DNA methyltransferase
LNSVNRCNVKSLNRMKNNLVELPISTRDGQFIAHYSERGLAALNFPKVGRASPRAAKKEIVPAKIRAWHRATEAALKNILAGRTLKTLPPLDMVGTAFQKSVWRAMLKISLGKTKSYGEIASAIGNPKAVRAVGGACGANPIPVLVPCHRVLAAHKKLGGFSSGLDWKRKLLAYEGMKLEFEKQASN